MNQALVDTGAATLFLLTTERALEQRDTRLRDLLTLPSAPGRAAHTALSLPGFFS
ncbi:hypothetical protein [Streptomyces longispororuber]|uniref:hypothetical protein n=1 Tax=Streptomyces longispororuber TaxID=68230 RepID=UPI003F55891A